MHKNGITRFYSLDALRGIAAIVVVAHHLLLFFSGHKYSDFLSHMPLSAWLVMFYHKGLLAVDLFFCLSGFVFYWLYSCRVASGVISTSWFFWLRLSRLYPLHIVTLVGVAFGQELLLDSTGSYFYVSKNDMTRFWESVLFIQSWGAGGILFNLPSWSISVEIFLYAAFYLCCRFIAFQRIMMAGIFAASMGYMMVYGGWYDDSIARGLASFFMGGLMFSVYRKIIASRCIDAIVRYSGCAVMYAWALTWSVSVLHIELGREFTNIWPIAVLFPVTILALALIETKKGAIGKSIAWLGDISYSVYLLHFPLQMVFYTFAWYYGGDVTFYSPWFMLAFFGVLLPLSWLSYHYFEVPVQNYLRRAVHFRKKQADDDKKALILQSPM